MEYRVREYWRDNTSGIGIENRWRDMEIEMSKMFDEGYFPYKFINTDRKNDEKSRIIVIYEREND